MEEELMTPKDISSLTGFSLSYLANQRSKKEGFPFYKFGRKVFYKKSEVLASIEGTRVSTTDQAGSHAC